MPNPEHFLLGVNPILPGFSTQPSRTFGTQPPKEEATKEKKDPSSNLAPGIQTLEIKSVVTGVTLLIAKIPGSSATNK